MVSANSLLFTTLLFFFLAVSLFSEAPLHALGQQTNWGSRETHYWLKRRVLMSFKENPAGSNATFECSLSGPCVPCLYSEKGDKKYCCSETGYRIPFKCTKIKVSVKDSKRTNSQNPQSSLEVSDNMEKLNEALHDAKEFTTSAKERSLPDDSSTSDNGSQAYITYRSCMPLASEEKLSVLSFEGIMIFLFLISGSFMYLRKKKAVSVSGFAAGRVQTNSWLTQKSVV